MKAGIKYGIGAAVVVGAIAAVWFFMNSIQSPREKIKENGVHIDVENLGFYTKNGRIAGKVYRPTDDTLHRYPAVIWCHGLGENAAKADEYLRAIASEGYVAYAFDFRGGSASSKSTGLTTKEMSVKTEMEDLKEVLEHMKELRYIDRRNIFLAGDSQGGLVAALVGISESRSVKGLILLYPAFNIPDDGRARYPKNRDIPDSTVVVGTTVGSVYYKDIRNLNPYKKLSRFGGDVLIIHGEADTMVPLSVSETLSGAFPSATLKTIPGAGHGFSGSARKTAISYIREFLDNQ